MMPMSRQTMSSVCRIKKYRMLNNFMHMTGEYERFFMVYQVVMLPSKLAG